MYRSSDGLTWQGIALGLQAHDLTWTGDRFVAAGWIEDLSLAAVGSSADGVEWTVQEPGPSGLYYSSLAKSDSEIIAFGAFDRLLTSPDGITWSERPSSLGGWVNDAAWGGGRWVAVGRLGETAVSADGVSWRVAVPTLFDSFYGGAAANNNLVTVVVGYDSTFGPAFIYRSTDGATWERLASPAVPMLWSLSSFGDLLLGVTNGGFATSPDGLGWTPVPVTPTAPYLSWLACSTVRCVAVGMEIMASDDAVTWSRAALPNGYTLTGVTWAGSRFVAVGRAFGGSGTLYMRSDDGEHWETRTQYGVFGPTSVAANGRSLVAVGGLQGHVYTGTDGFTWQDSVPVGGDGLSNVVWTGSFFAALGRKTGGILPALWVSWDGLAWAEVAVPGADDLRAIFGVGARLYLLGERGTILSTACGDYAVGHAPRRHLPSHR
jgi:hypothetical protein